MTVVTEHSLVNVGQQVGGPIGLAVVGTAARSAEPMSESAGDASSPGRAGVTRA